MKKHIEQMSKAEIKYLKQRFKSVPQHKWRLTGYCKKRAFQRGIDMSTFRSIWVDGYDLIEFHQHEESGECRVLLRSISTDPRDNQVCAVFCFTTLEVITIYNNWRMNKHRGLVWREYTSDMDIKGVMQSVQ